ncbi:hypothetical protein R1flu_005796 [Riccia fluitans]|uniref:Uncharacterized protein n=1 Tax=Riccia fluitans TaxID=41844 RepID=A0ABD1YX77_9MARC
MPYLVRFAYCMRATETECPIWQSAPTERTRQSYRRTLLTERAKSRNHRRLKTRLNIMGATEIFTNSSQSQIQRVGIRCIPCVFEEGLALALFHGGVRDLPSDHEGPSYRTAMLLASSSDSAPGTDSRLPRVADPLASTMQL